MIALLLALGCASPPPPQAAPKPPIHTSDLPDGSDVSAGLRGAVGEAERAGLKPVLYLGATWCQPCVAYERALFHPEMVAAHANVLLVKADFDRHGSALEAAGFVASGVPFWCHLDREGGNSGRCITGAAWGEDTPENMAPVLRPFFSDTPRTGTAP